MQALHIDQSLELQGDYLDRGIRRSGQCLVSVKVAQSATVGRDSMRMSCRAKSAAILASVRAGLVSTTVMSRWLIDALIGVLCWREMTRKSFGGRVTAKNQDAATLYVFARFCECR